ncbi:methylated-DNA-[protein]-cysteine S-methyltransferase [Paraburkholderia sp. GAS41]|jgi:methylated-DNA-[protein]-cysteine S-methyltransferase|uniref:methylated-DNA--[protein]-cysteine S-methyltransferase n=1 Tax=Paraburkholderia sp. GAS41 TaxID=3035134 RepID=UPI003D24BC70
MALEYMITDSPVGKLKLVARDTQLIAVLWENERRNCVKLGEMQPADDNPVLLDAEWQLREFFAGERTQFDLDIAMEGTPFQKRVWNALLDIPFGERRTYRDIATRIGNREAVRAVGAAIGRNPLSIVTPCHRVVGSSGSLTGFAGGLPTKALLLDTEDRAARGIA